MTETAQNLYKTGDKYHTDEDLKNAKKHYKLAIKADPNHYDSLRWLADIYLDGEDYETAISYFERAKAVNPNDADMLNDLGLCYYENYQYKLSLDTYALGLKIKPNHDTIHSNLGKALYEHNIENEKSAKKFAKWWLENFPKSDDAKVIGSAILGKQLSQQNKKYVKQIFDDFAEDFDEKLAELNYKAPELLSELWKKYAPKTSEKILDAGCGTGLLSPHINSSCKHLYGVDLSDEMLKLAEARELYSSLQCADLIGYLNKSKNTFNGIIASDVLCYFGDLGDVFKSTYNALQPDSHFAFSVEKNTTNKDNYFLTPSGRYVHNGDYIKSILTETGFTILEISNETLRTEHDNPVRGLITIAKKA